MTLFSFFFLHCTLLLIFIGCWCYYFVRLLQFRPVKNTYHQQDHVMKYKSDRMTIVVCVPPTTHCMMYDDDICICAMCMCLWCGRWSIPLYRHRHRKCNEFYAIENRFDWKLSLELLNNSNGGEHVGSLMNFVFFLSFVCVHATWNVQLMLTAMFKCDSTDKWNILDQLNWEGAIYDDRERMPVSIQWDGKFHEEIHMPALHSSFISSVRISIHSGWWTMTCKSRKNL